MKTYTRFGLMVMVIAILLLVLVVPALAKKNEPYQCYVQAVMFNRGGEFESFRVYGEDLDAGWKDGVLYNICTGNIPFTDPSSDSSNSPFFTLVIIC